MEQINQHEMSYVKSFPSGAEEWACTSCARRFIVVWPPQFNKIVLESGDEYAFHSGGKGSLRPKLSQVQPEDSHHLSEEWWMAIDSLDFGDWPDEGEED